MVHGRARIIAIAAVSAITLGLLSRCSNERALAPVPQHYRLYAGMHGGPANPSGWIGVFDCDTDSLVDSLSYPGMSVAYGGYASPDGKYLATQEAGRQTRIWDIQNGTQVVVLPRSHFSVTFFPEDSLALASAVDSTFVYHLPSFDVDTVIPIRLWYSRRIPNSTSVLAISARGSVTATVDRSLLLVFDTKSMSVTDSIVIESDPQGFGFDVFSFDLPQTGNMLYAVGASPAGGRWLIGYDLTSRTVVFRRELVSATGSCRVSCDGREVWVTDPGSYSAVYPVWPGLILVFDATHGSLIDSIVTTGIHEGSPTQPLFVKDIRFAPETDKLYVTTGRTNLSGFPLLIIDSKSREIENVLLPNAPYLPGFIEVVPNY